jgi:hypothetical protein
MRQFALVLCLFSLACEADIGAEFSDPDDNEILETESDADADADADADGDADDNVEPEEELGNPVGIELRLTYETWEEGELECAKAVEVVGTPYTGDCDGCDFAFSVEGTLVEDNSAPYGCYVPDALLMRTDSGLSDMVLAHADVLDVVDSYGEISTYTDALFIQYMSDAMGYYGSYGELTQRVLAHADGEETIGVFSQDGMEVEWGIESESTNNGEEIVLDWCDYSYTYSEAESNLGGPRMGTSELDCEGDKLDVWSFVVDETQTVSVTVDTLGLDTAFDPRLYLVGPSECVDFSTDDDFDCSYPPPRFQCPAIEAELTPGTWNAVVSAFPKSCAADIEEGSYEILLNSSTRIRGSLAEDDINRYAPLRYIEHLNASGELSYE